MAVSERIQCYLLGTNRQPAFDSLFVRISTIVEEYSATNVLEAIHFHSYCKLGQPELRNRSR